MIQWFHELSKKRQLEIEEKMILFITGKNVTNNYIGENIGWLYNDGNRHALRISDATYAEKYDDPPVMFYFNGQLSCYLKKLPDKVLLLIAVIHRPFYNLYKEIIGNKNG